jgi:hypothetical protein
MKEYNDDMPVKDALQLYFSKYHFADGGYNLKWFKIKIGPIYIPLPNTKGRIAAVKIHDIHHLLTEYKANLRGEAQIGGWELASGCGKHIEAWALNFGSFSYGIIFFPRALFKAFLNGRAMTANLYYNITYNEALLNKTVGDLRAYTGVATPKKNSLKDYLLFVLWTLGSMVYIAVFFLCVYAAAMFVLHLFK